MKPEFIPFKKIPRISRECIITEKIDGTNASITITESGELYVGSRTRWITPEEDNYGFAKWVQEHNNELRSLGVGTHFGEWWGGKIQRGYGRTDRVFSLFNTSKWTVELAPKCCSVVPVLYRGLFSTNAVDIALNCLKTNGSYAQPGYMKPEGIIIYHVAGNLFFKKTIEKDEEPKGLK